MTWRNSFLLFLIGATLVFIQVACETNTVSPDVVGISGDYYPLEVGRYSIYKASETKYTFVDGIIKRDFFIRELISDTVRLQDKTIAFRIERASRKDTAFPWQLDSIYIAYKKGNELIRVESSIPYVKLLFPLKYNSTWNGNLYNNNGGNIPEIYRVIKITNSTDSSILSTKRRLIQVLHRADSNCRTNTYETETYAENIGLVERTYRNYGYKESDPPCTGPAIIEVGKDFKQTLIEVGK